MAMTSGLSIAQAASPLISVFDEEQHGVDLMCSEASVRVGVQASPHHTCKADATHTGLWWQTTQVNLHSKEPCQVLGSRPVDGTFEMLMTARRNKLFRVDLALLLWYGMQAV